MKIFLIVLCILAVVGCTKNNADVPEISIDQNPNANLSQILQSNKILAYLDNQVIKVVDTQTNLSSPVYTLTEDEFIPLYQLSDLKMSPDRKYLIWYSPIKGLLSYNLEELSKPKLLVSATQWMSNNPYYTFDSSSSTVYIITNEGNTLSVFSPEGELIDTIQIPFPFGSEFKISPDGEKIVFVAGFGQSKLDPEYMVTDINGENPTRFTTETLLHLRNMIDWLPDSSGLLMISSNSQEIVFVDIQGKESSFYAHPNQEESIIQLYVRDSHVLYFTSSKRWHVLDVDTKKETARLPIEIAGDLHNPNFIPWDKNQFLIEETIRSNNQEFKRLWLSEFNGKKTKIIGEYATKKISTDTPEI